MPTVLYPRLDATLYTELAKAARNVLLASPFLTMPVAQALKRIKHGSAASWTLLTCLDARAVAARALSTSGLSDLVEEGVEVRHVAALHAKAFLADDFFGTVGSANLTAAGLGSADRANVELSVQLEADQVPELRRTVQAWAASAPPVSVRNLRDLEERARRLPRPPVPAAGDLELASGPADELPAIPAEVSLWAKAQYGEPDWAQWRTPYWFSSRADRRPGFKPGDLVLIYAQATHACYAVVEVTDDPTFDPEFVNQHRDGGERWPWVNRTRSFLVPDDGRTVSPLELGFTGQSLQGGHKRLDLSQMLTAIDVLTTPASA